MFCASISIFIARNVFVSFRSSSYSSNFFSLVKLLNYEKLEFSFGRAARTLKLHRHYDNKFPERFYAWRLAFATWCPGAHIYSAVCLSVNGWMEMVWWFGNILPSFIIMYHYTMMIIIVLVITLVRSIVRPSLMLLARQFEMTHTHLPVVSRRRVCVEDFSLCLLVLEST